jgi:hypothetical protein
MHLHESANPPCDRKSDRKAALQIGKPARRCQQPSGEVAGHVLYTLLLDLSIIRRAFGSPSAADVIRFELKGSARTFRPIVAGFINTYIYSY